MRRLLSLLSAGAAFLSMVPAASASDHADPFANPLFFWKTVPPASSISDLFVFPDFSIPDNPQLVVIFCVNPGLRGDPMNLDQYEYSVHMDLATPVSHQDKQNNARYGGTVADLGKSIKATTTLKFNFKVTDGETKDKPKRVETRAKPTITGIREDEIDVWGKEVDSIRSVARWTDVSMGNEYNLDQSKPNFDKVNIWTGISDDPFIFPNFFGTNIVSTVTTIPLKKYFGEQLDWIVWGTATKDGELVDHVGRSLRTQNPRFDIINTLPPSEHVERIRQERASPGIMKDIFVWLGFNMLFSYRSWDEVPDVMLFTLRKGEDFGHYETTGADGKPVINANESDGKSASFPNGRFLTDDVADRLARYGDTLLKELSYLVPPCQKTDTSPPDCSMASWPRRTANDKAFQAHFPYLPPPWTGSDVRAKQPPPALHPNTMMTLAIAAIVIVLLWVLTAWLLALWWDYRRRQRRYL